MSKLEITCCTACGRSRKKRPWWLQQCQSASHKSDYFHGLAVLECNSKEKVPTTYRWKRKEFPFNVVKWYRKSQNGKSVDAKSMRCTRLQWWSSALGFGGPTKHLMRSNRGQELKLDLVHLPPTENSALPNRLHQTTPKPFSIGRTSFSVQVGLYSPDHKVLFPFGKVRK